MVGSSPSTSTGAPQLSPSVVVIIVLITVVFFLSGFLHLLARCFARTSSSNNGLSRRNNSSGSLNSLQGQLQHLFHLHDSGVEQAFIDALPVFLYRAVRGLKDGADCAVCLNEFSGDDKLRLLPKCSHAFHIECIDTWLLSHSTCPLCRCSLLPDASGSSLGCTPAVLGGIRVDSFGASSVATTMTDSSAVVDCGTTDAQHNPAATHEVPPRVVPVKLGRLVPNPAAPGDESAVISCRRSYSMGSYEYVVTGEEQMAVLVVAPTPMHRKWKPPGTPGHRTALSECIPERGGSPWVTIDIDPRPMVDQQRASLSWAPWRKKGSTASTVRDKSFNSDKMNSLSSFSFRLNADQLSTSEEQSSAVWWWKNRVTSEQHNGNNNNNNNSSSWDQASICSTNAEMKSTGSAASSMASVSIVARRTLQWLMGRDRHRSSTEEIAH